MWTKLKKINLLLVKVIESLRQNFKGALFPKRPQLEESGQDGRIHLVVFKTLQTSVRFFSQQLENKNISLQGLENIILGILRCFMDN